MASAGWRAGGDLPSRCRGCRSAQCRRHRPRRARRPYRSGDGRRDGRLEQGIGGCLPAGAAAGSGPCGGPWVSSSTSRGFCVTGAIWDGLEALLLHRVRAGAEGVSPFDVLSCASTLADQKSAASRWAAAKARGATPVVRTAAAARDGRLRIGYLSADFREHAMGHLMVDALETHDRSRFAVTAYSTGIDDGSALRQRFQRGIERFVDLRRHTDADAARAIAADGIDILVDLTGFTTFFAHLHPGRPSGSGTGQLAGLSGHAGGGLCRLHRGRSHGDRTGRGGFLRRTGGAAAGLLPAPTTAGAPSPRPRRPGRSAGCRPKASSSACFNSAHKLTPVQFDGWSRILAAVPGSVLWLYAGHPQVAANLCREGEARGLDPGRLVFARPVPHAEHLARHRLADLFLDTLPYNAHTTASDALWAGLPVLTLQGTTFAGRVAAGLLRAAGLPELIADGQEAYEAAAVGLARSPDRLCKLRAAAGAQPAGLPAVRHAALYPGIWRRPTGRCGRSTAPAGRRARSQSPPTAVRTPPHRKKERSHDDRRRRGRRGSTSSSPTGIAKAISGSSFHG